MNTNLNTTQIEMDIQEPFIIQPTTNYKDDPVYIITTLLLFTTCLTFSPWLLIALYCVYKHNEDERVKRNVFIAKILLVLYFIVITVVLITGLVIAYV